jgi:hypothetical protein
LQNTAALDHKTTSQLVWDYISTLMTNIKVNYEQLALKDNNVFWLDVEVSNTEMEKCDTLYQLVTETHDLLTAKQSDCESKV